MVLARLHYSSHNHPECKVPAKESLTTTENQETKQSSKNSVPSISEGWTEPMITQTETLLNASDQFISSKRLPASEGHDVMPMIGHTINRREVEHTFSELVRQAGTQSTNTIFTALTSSWNHLYHLESLCPSWASYTGGTDIPNSLFHRHQLQFGPSLVCLFSYHALLDEVRKVLSEASLGEAVQRQKLVNSLVVLDSMRCRLESENTIGREAQLYENALRKNRCQIKPQTASNNASQKAEYPPAALSTLDSDCISTTSEGSGTSRFISEDEDDESKGRFNSKIMRSKWKTAIASNSLPQGIYVAMTRGELLSALKSVQIIDYKVTAQCQSSKDDHGIFEVQTPQAEAEAVAPILFNRASDEVMRIAKSADIHPSRLETIQNRKGCTNTTDQPFDDANTSSFGFCNTVNYPAEITDDSNTQGVTELVELLDQIREVLELPTKGDESSVEADAESSTPKLFGDVSADVGLLNTSTEASLTIKQASDAVLRLLDLYPKASETGGDGETLTWLELANCLVDVPETTTTLVTPALSTSKRGAKQSNLNIQVKGGKRRKINSSAAITDLDITALPGYQQNSTLPVSEQQHISSTTPDTATPCPGVCWDPTHQRWVAHWSDARTHQRIRKYFNPKLLGFEKARLLAILTRKEAVDSGRASMMIKADRPKTLSGFPIISDAFSTFKSCELSSEQRSTSISSDDPADHKYLKGVYYSSSDESWYAHWKSNDSSEIQLKEFKVSDFLTDAQGDKNLAMRNVRAMATEWRQNAVTAMLAQAKSQEPIQQQVLPTPLQVSAEISHLQSGTTVPGAVISGKGVVTTPSVAQNSTPFSIFTPVALETASGKYSGCSMSQLTSTETLSSINDQPLIRGVSTQAAEVFPNTTLTKQKAGSKVVVIEQQLTLQSDRPKVLQQHFAVPVPLTVQPLQHQSMQSVSLNQLTSTPYTMFWTPVPSPAEQKRIVG